MQLTERLLNDAGGWQVMKHARSLHGAGRVTEATWDQTVLAGYVREGETRYKSGLRFISKTNIENLCTCRDSKIRGLVCAHSLAVGLEVLKPCEPPKHATIAPSVQPTPAVSSPAGLPAGFSLEEGTPIALEVVLPPNFVQAIGKSAVMVGVEVVLEGKRMLLSALARSITYRVGAEDGRLLGTLCALGGDGSLPGMLSLNKEAFLTLLGALVGHPRVGLARRMALQVLEESLSPKLFSKPLPNGDLALRCELPAGGSLICGGKAAWMWRDTALQPVARGLPPAYLPLLLGEVVIPAGAVDGFLQKEWGALALRFSCENVRLPDPAAKRTPTESGDEFDPEEPLSGGAALRPEFLLRIEGSLNFLS
ncbi:MAG: hypothetical protein EBS01_13975, partial [Verrucomicrobia bacterium]|nr:hypothetical protein [Verrucomicrobiota bacterium]